MNRLSFDVGALLYTPANNMTIASHILNRDWPGLSAVCLCLEDSIQESGLLQAEFQLKQTLETLQQTDDSLPRLFVRVKSPEHFSHVNDMLGEAADVLTGYVFPKFDLTNSEEYLKKTELINSTRKVPVYVMPILESMQIARRDTRLNTLKTLREIVDSHRENILSIRVGGNDFCNLFGLRRSVRQTIYDLGVVRDILIDIVNMFSDDYVVSGPVWEYYGAVRDGEWAQGLRHELDLDIANGFFGKTAIHPVQLPIIRESLKVPLVDVIDARQILNWTDDQCGVAGSSVAGRMNEVRCHGRWAERILLRADIYGICGEGQDAHLV